MAIEPTKEPRLTAEVKEKVIGYILAAFGLIAGLAWNDAIASLIEKFFPGGSNGLIAKFTYAIILTLIIVIISIYLTRLVKKQK